MKHFLVFVWPVVFLALISCGGEKPAAEGSKPDPGAPAPISQSGVVAGTIKFIGAAPPAKKIAVTKDKNACGEYKWSEELVVGSGNGIRWAVVSVDAMPALARVSTPSAQPAVLDQKGCQFHPHVLLVRAGGTVEILNPDGVLHNFHSYSKLNTPINQAQPAFRKTMQVKLDRPETFKIGCDAHGWMSGWIVVTDHPFYALSDEAGNFRIEGVPAGKQVIKVWHETLGMHSKEVEISAGKETKVVFELDKKK